ncbi:copper amine oxidase N-terminal domain-containing protein [Tepidibacter formicigenes]|uniref:Copper amine oxidase N-terminal domain-containing protein n=1 Tax=Tepidibacter formicigenes DSM 15518 TaxID=1123349 RepID=A0A1M6LWF2_9FIRM|nr:copper amine oxidase N-terminal domain-containing protein [Tepidibacter formicigenes]SHJ75490.1 Copper amine oxidase N-terminal domain-containing protein [Tepidibacter formicigenes DSM 15518]
MRKISYFLVFITILLSTTSPFILAIDKQIKITINNEILEFDISPIIENNKTLAPVRTICEKLEADITWIEDNKEIIIKKNNTTIKIKINDEKAYVNDKLVILNATPKIVSNKALAPIRFICENLNMNVVWDDKNYTVVINDNYNNIYNSLKKSLNYKGEFDMKMVMNIKIEDIDSLQFNYNIEGLTDSKNSNINGIMYLIKSDDANIQVPYKLINVNEKKYIKYLDKWNNKENIENADYFDVDLNLINSLNNRLISNFKNLTINKINSGYLINYTNEEFDNCMIEIYLNDKNEIIKEIATYTIHSIQKEKKVDTQFIIDVDFKNTKNEIKINPPIKS